MNPILSVIIPCYGVEKYLNRCMESIVGQKLSNIEIILVDDGSPDAVPGMCDAWAKKDVRIKVIHKENGGLGYARNSGLEVATGKYVAFIDSDDFISNEMFDALVNKAEATGVDAAFCGYSREIPSGTWQPILDFSQEKIMCKFEYEEYVLSMIASAPYVKKERLYTMSVWHAVYRRAIIYNNKIRFHSEREIVSEDIPFQVDFMKCASRAIFIPETFYYYCLNGSSLSSTFREEKFEKFILLRDLLINKLDGAAEAIQRADRLLIGFTRSYLQSLVKSERADKLAIIGQVLSNGIWNVLRGEYKPSYLPFYQGLLYNMILSGSTIGVYLMAYISMKAKKAMKKRI
mgnify:CR=1 FL=1